MHRLDDSVSSSNRATNILGMINMQSQNEEHFATKKAKLTPALTELEDWSQSIKQHGRSMERSKLCGLIEALYRERRDLMLQLVMTSNSAICNILTDERKVKNLEE